MNNLMQLLLEIKRQKDRGLYSFQTNYDKHFMHGYDSSTNAFTQGLWELGQKELDLMIETVQFAMDKGKK